MDSLNQCKLPPSTVDGETRTFHPAQHIPFTHADTVVYINGMNTDGYVQANTASAIADLLGVRVIGVYNLTGFESMQLIRKFAERLRAGCAQLNALADRLERESRLNARSGWKSIGSGISSLRPGEIQHGLSRLGTSAGLQHAGLNTRLAALHTCGTAEGVEAVGSATFVADLLQSAVDYVGAAYSDQWDRRQGAASLLPEQARHAIALHTLSGNRATLALYALLRAHVLFGGAAARVIAHSQGNLITANAVAALGWVRGRSHALSEVHVYSLASPSPSWPRRTGMQLHGPYNFPDDNVTRLSNPLTGVLIPVFNPAVEGVRSTVAGERHGLSELATGANWSDNHVVKRYLEDSGVIDDLRRDMKLPDN